MGGLVKLKVYVRSNHFKSENLMHVFLILLKLLPKLGNIFHEISKKPSYVRTEVGGRVDQKCNDFERAYFMADP